MSDDALDVFLESITDKVDGILERGVNTSDGLRQVLAKGRVEEIRSDEPWTTMSERNIVRRSPHAVFSAAAVIVAAVVAIAAGIRYSQDFLPRSNPDPAAANIPWTGRPNWGNSTAGGSATTLNQGTQDAQEQLQTQVAHDRATAETLIGFWVPQLSSLKPGLVTNGVTYDYDAIWMNFRALQSQYPQALLLWSGDFKSYKSADFFVTVLPEPFSTGQAANAWCDEQGLSLDTCYAKRLNHVGGYAGNTMLRMGGAAGISYRDPDQGHTDFNDSVAVEPPAASRTHATDFLP